MIAIVGGGISGLSTAFYLAKAGVPATVVEARPRLGGVIQTEHVQGCIVEAGPDSFLSAKPWAMDLIRDLGLTDEVIGSNDHLRKTYIWKKRRLIPLPDGLQLMVPTKILPMITTGLLRWPTKLRMATEWFRSPSPSTKPDRSVAEFIEDHYGKEVVDYLAEPLLSGIYGGTPQQLSARSVLTRFVELEGKYGSLTRGVLRERSTGNPSPIFQTLKGGLGQLVDALSSAIRDKAAVIHERVEAIEPCGQGFRIRLAGAWMNADKLVLACEAHQAAGLVRAIDPALSELLTQVPYSSSMTLALGFERRAFAQPLDGFGFLVPKRERRRLVACTWVGTKFSHRVPEGMVLLRCFLGGVGDEAVLSEKDETIISSVLSELREMVALTGRPLFWRLFRWPRSMAQYTVGHQQRIAEVEGRLAQIQGLYLAGNAYHGIGIPDCIRMGKEAAGWAAGRLKNTASWRAGSGAPDSPQPR